ncbi:MAG: ATP-dependent sacrificial sulfur transferase LarE [Planctomycetota bacterium]|nr:ATP-dependent sacrificial sulfur transferase LarE [Planctomycetota bacterium]
MTPENNPVVEPSAEARQKLARLEEILAGYGSVLIAYSGGVDSTFLAVVAQRVLKDKVLAVTAASESLAPEEREEAIAWAKQLGFAHEVVRTEELRDENYASNTLDRCFYCKVDLMGKLGEIAKQRGLRVIALGATVDDLGDYRPGETGAAQHGAVFPLREAGLSKADIRALSREMGLPSWDKPAAACLASRIPFGERVTAEKLSQVARGESFLRQAGFRACRLRHHGAIARIEVPARAIPALLGKAAEVVKALKALGFVYVTVDLQGLRSGSMHEAAPGPKPKTGR